MILAIDPGFTTGLAWLTAPVRVFGFAEVVGRHQMFTWLRMNHHHFGIEELVIEDWTVRSDTSKKSQQVDPWRIIGYAEGFCHEYGITFTTQMPGQGKSFGTDDKLAKLGWLATTKGGHARDAARHLLTYLVQRYPGQGQIGQDLLEALVQ